MVLPYQPPAFNSAETVPQAKKGLIRFNSILHSSRWLPAGCRVTATTSTDQPAATALVSRLNNGSTEHGPLQLTVPRLPRKCSKFCRRWELKVLLTGDSAKCSPQTLTILLDLPAPTHILPYLQQHILNCKPCALFLPFTIIFYSVLICHMKFQ